jgi:hypothetical protein
LAKPHRLERIEAAFHPLDTSVLRAALFELLAEGSVVAGIAHQQTLTLQVPADPLADPRCQCLQLLGGCIGLLAAQGEGSGITEAYRQDADFEV